MDFTEQRARSLILHSDRALAQMLADLRRYAPKWEESEWVRERLDLLRAEIARRKKEDAEGML
jgi:hypothetical protein